jgi:HTH-type transcriptional regulator/antitoxin HigA
MREFPLRPLRTKKDAEAATKILDRLFREDYDDPGEEAYVYFLSLAMMEYEERYDPTPQTSSGLDILKFIIQENNMTQAQLGELLGISQGAASMILKGERQITAEHARRLGKRFKLDPGAFI